MYNCIAHEISLFKTVQVHLELLVSPCEDLQVCTVRREHATIINSKLQGHFRVTSRRDQGSLLTLSPGLPHPQCLIVSSTVSRGGEDLGTKLHVWSIGWLNFVFIWSYLWYWVDGWVCGRLPPKVLEGATLGSVIHPRPCVHLPPVQIEKLAFTILHVILPGSLIAIAICWNTKHSIIFTQYQALYPSL